ncbi:MAG TPA: PfkB family carbohydrate kinase, partial [Planctomycetia bacterium]|nr:PfkB family carbohydrate kinase [Planctomycetia bacterium]
VLGGAFRVAPGGKGANQAIAAARAGATVTFLAAVGSDGYGADFTTAWRSEGIDVSRVLVKPGPSGVALIVTDAEGRNQIAVAPGANALLAPADVAAVPPETWRSGGAFVVQGESPPDTVHAALGRARAGGMTTIVNLAPYSVELAEAARGMTDYLIGNEGEMAAFFGLEEWPEAPSDHQVKVWLAKANATLVTTLGEKGYWLAMGPAESPRTFAAPAPRVLVADSVGAGDAFVGVFAAALAAGLEPARAAARANCAAALACTRPGADPPRREEIDAAEL